MQVLLLCSSYAHFIIEKKKPWNYVQCHVQVLQIVILQLAFISPSSSSLAADTQMVRMSLSSCWSLFYSLLWIESVDSAILICCHMICTCTFYHSSMIVLKCFWPAITPILWTPQVLDNALTWTSNPNIHLRATEVHGALHFGRWYKLHTNHVVLTLTNRRGWNRLRWWIWSFTFRVFFSRSFSHSTTLKRIYPSFCSVGLLGSKLLPELISAILNRYVTLTTPTN